MILPPIPSVATLSTRLFSASRLNCAWKFLLPPLKSAETSSAKAFWKIYWTCSGCQEKEIFFSRSLWVENADVQVLCSFSVFDMVFRGNERNLLRPNAYQPSAASSWFISADEDKIIASSATRIVGINWKTRSAQTSAIWPAREVHWAQHTFE